MRVVSDRPEWADVLISVLRFLLTLLSGAGGAVALIAQNSPGVRAAGIEPAAQWFWMILIACLVLALLSWLFTLWRKKRQDVEGELLDQVLDFVDWALDALREETGKRLREIPQSAVEDAARQVYQTFIKTSPLSIVPEDVFVGFVVDRWRQIAGVQVRVKLVAARLE